MNTYTFDSKSLIPFFAESVLQPDSRGYASVSSQVIDATCTALQESFGDELLMQVAGPAIAIIELLQLAVSAHPTFEVDESALLTVFVEPATGEVTKVYGPALFSSGDQTVLRFGKNAIPVATQGDRITVGNITGRILFESVDFAEGSYLRGELLIKNGDSSYQIPAIFPRGNDLTPHTLVDSLDNGSLLAHFLQPLTSGGKFLKLGQLQVGEEYEVAGIDGTGKPTYCQYRLELVDGRLVELDQKLKDRIVGIASANLEAASRHFSGYILKILEITEKQGKFYVVHTFSRPQRLALGATLANATGALPAATPKQLPAAEAPKPVSFAENRLAAMRAKAQAKAPVAAGSANYDDIPF